MPCFMQNKSFIFNLLKDSSSHHHTIFHVTMKTGSIIFVTIFTDSIVDPASTCRKGLIITYYLIKYLFIYLLFICSFLCFSFIYLFIYIIKSRYLFVFS